MLYTRRKAKLLAAGVQPTLKHIIFLRTALGGAVSLQPLITSQGGSSFIQGGPASESEWPSTSLAAAAAGAVHFEAIKAALAQQSQQVNAELREVRESNGRMHGDLQREVRESIGRMHIEVSDMKQQQRDTNRSLASLTSQVLNSAAARKLDQ